MSNRRSFLARLWRDQCGGAAVEAAFCVPVFMMMVGGAFWFGQTQHQMSTVRYALQGAGRALVLNPDLTEAQLAAKVSQDTKIAPEDLAFGLEVDNAAALREATLTATYSRLIDIPFAGSFDLSRTAVVRVSLPLIF